MSQEKAQLIAPIDSSFTVPGLTVSGVITATSFDGTITGVADSITQGNNLNVGVITALSFAGNLTGDAGGLIGSPNTVAGVVTATSFVGGLTGNITGDLIGNATGVGASIKQGVNLNVGIATAWKWYGDGSGLTGIAGSAFAAQKVTASSAETIIDLTYGNLIYFDQTTASTTVGFASTAATQEISIVRATDATTPSFTTGSVDFDGTDDILQTSTSTDYQLGTSSFTVEAWIYNENPGENRCIAEFAQGTTAYYGPLFLYQNDSGATYKFWASSNGSSWDVAAGQSYGAVVADTWEHFALVRDGNTFYGFRNGEQKWTFTSSASLYQNVNQITIGRSQSALGGTPYFEGKISNFRFVKGTALYTSDFDVSYADLTNVTNTKLLCCQSDSSATAATVGSVSETSSPTAGSVTISSSSSSTPSITWPDRIKWSGGSAPTLFDNVRASAAQVFRFLSTDSGLTYTGWEEMKGDPQFFTAWRCGFGNGRGDMGLNSTGYANTRRSSPMQLAGKWTGLSNINSGGGAMTLGTRSDGTLWAWGWNAPSGALGLNNRTNYSSPTQVGTDTTWDKYLSSGSGASGCIASKTDGTLWSWGYNTQGNLGHNDRTQRSSPTQIPGTWGISSRSGVVYDANGGSAAAIKSDGTLWTWGNNSQGLLGLNQSGPTKLSSPTQIPGSTWKEICIGYLSMHAIKTDGTAWAWGYNDRGPLGLNDRTHRSSPTQIPGTNWNTAFVNNSGQQNVGAVKTDGTLWRWGYNNKGQLGLNDVIQRSSPTQLPGTTWKTGANNSESSVWLVKTDGTLWANGYNYAGSLGLNVAYSGNGYSSPVQVGTSTDWFIVGGNEKSMWGLRY